MLKMKLRDKKIKELLETKNITGVLLSNPIKLRNETNLLAFEQCFDKEKEDDSVLYQGHLEKAKEVFTDLIVKREISDDIVKSYIVYLASKYKLFYLSDNQAVKNELIYLVGDKNIYVRENALKCIYGIGDKELVAEALFTMQNRGIHHNRKLLHDGLLDYVGDKKELSDLLLTKFEDYDLQMQIMLSIFFRYTCGDYCQYALDILKDEYRDKELRISALRYLQKYPYRYALPTIVSLVDYDQQLWEYRAVAATCLGSYRYKDSVEALKKAMTDPIWYVRKNAAESLIKLNVKQEQFNQILNGNDPYAKEQLQYKLDEKALILEAKAKWY